jgi:hypothetical protein
MVIEINTKTKQFWVDFEEYSFQYGAILNEIKTQAQGDKWFITDVVYSGGIFKSHLLSLPLEDLCKISNAWERLVDHIIDFQHATNGMIDYFEFLSDILNFTPGCENMKNTYVL